jgi:translation initiation factor IF-2
MSVRVHDLAKKIGLSNKELIEKLKGMNYPVKSHSSTVDKITAEAIAKEYGVELIPAPPKPKTAPPPPAPTLPISAPPPPPPPAPVAPPKLVPTPQISAPKPTPKFVPPLQPAKPAPPPVIAKSAPATAQTQTVEAPPTGKTIHMKPPIVVRELAGELGLKAYQLISELMEMNVFAALNDTLDESVAAKIAARHGFAFEVEKRERHAGVIHKPTRVIELDEEDKPEDLQPRPPVVVFMGHVDHGKTSLLDAIRKTNVTADEPGGITQHIGASVVKVGEKSITFLDTPGHEAFTKMRARGAHVTDIAVLVVAADDGVMPQTLEAISHARAAQVPIIVAVNKTDLPNASPDRVKKQLQEQGLAPEAWGGDTITVDVSAKTKKGIEQLLEMILLQAEIMELKASPNRRAKGNVIEAQLEAGIGPSATVLVRKGTLKIGDALICGPYWGKVKALINDKGQRVKEAGPSTPVKIVGLTGVPEAGSEFNVLASEKEARQLSEERLEELRLGKQTPKRATLENIFEQIESGRRKTLRLIIKADTQGSAEAIAESLGKIQSDKVDAEIIHTAVGNITENDVLLASASDAIIIGFQVKLETDVSEAAKREGVQIKLYSIIYELLEQIEEAMVGLLEPEQREVTVGVAEVRQVFALSKGAPVAGCIVSSGRLVRGGRVRVLRRKSVQFEGRIASLRRFQDDVNEVRAGLECGVRVENFGGFEVGDVLECFHIEKIAAKL